MSNNTIATIPTNVSDELVLRRFLDTLVEKLDVAFGYRSGINFLVRSIAEEAIAETIVKQSAIADLNYSAPAISATYDQAEVQALADSLETTSDKVDTLLAALRSANILEV